MADDLTFRLTTTRRFSEIARAEIKNLTHRAQEHGIFGKRIVEIRIVGTHVVICLILRPATKEEIVSTIGGRWIGRVVQVGYGTAAWRAVDELLVWTQIQSQRD